MIRFFLLFIFVAPALLAAETKKKLIEFGWDEPSPAFMRQHIAEMEQTPFDGCVFDVPLTGAGWGHRAFTEAELQPALDDLKATHFHRFKNNFLRFDVTPGDVDWFDDFGPILNNARLAARIARKGKCQGILFDIEEYAAKLFEYDKQRDQKTKSWELYAAQARRRGHEVMDAFQSEFPGVIIFLTYGYTLPWEYTDHGVKSLANVNYGLLAPFLDGMVAASRREKSIVDGGEGAYSFTNTARFAELYKTMTSGALPMVADPDKYHRTFSCGFGVWMDYDWRKRGWETNDVEKNYYTPARLEASVRAALQTADEYVWVYTEKPWWWTANGGPASLPPAYAEAVRRAAASATRMSRHNAASDGSRRNGLKPND